MKKIAIAVAAAAMMSLAACGDQPAAETNNATNEAVVNEVANDANAMDNAANATAASANTANATNAM